MEGSFNFSKIQTAHQDGTPSCEEKVQLVEHVLPLGYVDFIPALLKPSGILSSAEYERFEYVREQVCLH